MKKNDALINKPISELPSLQVNLQTNTYDKKDTSMEDDFNTRSDDFDSTQRRPYKETNKNEVK